MQKETNLLIVIVCYKAVDLTIDCLRSISEQIHDVAGVHVAVCENGTGEASARQLADAIESEGWAPWCWLKVISPNRGFSGGNNAILEDALSWENPPKHFLLLNADTVVRPGAIRTLMNVADSQPEAGIISPRLEWPDGEPQISCFRYINPVSEMLDAASTRPISKLFKSYEVAIPVSDMPTEPDWTSFACALIRREVLEAIGVLDPGFFLYFDDPDYCRRARKAGWKVLNWPQAKVVHLRGQSNPVKELTAKRDRRPSYYYASRSRYLAKFYGRVGLWFSNMLWLFGRTVALLREVLGSKKPHTCKGEAKDIWTNWSHPMRTTGRLGDQSR